MGRPVAGQRTSPPKVHLIWSITTVLVAKCITLQLYILSNPTCGSTLLDQQVQILLDHGIGDGAPVSQLSLQGLQASPLFQQVFHAGRIDRQGLHRSLKAFGRHHFAARVLFATTNRTASGRRKGFGKTAERGRKAEL